MKICPDFTKQLQTVYRAWHALYFPALCRWQNIAEYTPQQAREQLLPKLSLVRRARVRPSVPPIGKVDIGDEAGF
jgi:hypothetical protein